MHTGSHNTAQNVLLIRNGGIQILDLTAVVVIHTYVQ